MKVNLYRPTRMTKCALIVMLVLLVGICLTSQPATSQVQYAYFPSQGQTDGRFLSIAGSGIQTLGNTIKLKLASPDFSANIRIGIFDGETGGTWDLGDIPLEYTLFADPLGDGSGTVQVGQWIGTSSMPDNDWFNITVTNSPDAMSLCGDFYYLLRVRSTNPLVTSWSNFKVRTDGAISALAGVPITYNAPMGSALDAAIIYPSYPTLTPTRYDGTWNFFVELPTPVSTFVMWDGDLDYGSYDCSVRDDDDQDTPNLAVEPWMLGSSALPEGIPTTGVNCQDAAGNNIGGMTTSNPPDDARLPIFRRSPNVRYDVIAPNTLSYANNNPSGNVEWEQFRLSTSAFDRNQMDYQATSLPAGFYRIRIEGVDMSNLNAFRFLQDALGVDSTGAPVSMPVCSGQPTQGEITGLVSYDGNRNCKLDAGEVGIKNVQVFLDADYNNDGLVDNTNQTLTDANGMYSFTDLPVGKYRVRINTSTLPDGVDPSYDFDGISTPHNATTQITAAHLEEVMNFGYKVECAPGTATIGYWKNHTDKWPVSSLTLGNVTYNKTELVAILKKSPSGDNTYSMAHQLIATKLNLLMGNDGSCIATKVVAADEWLKENPIGGGASTLDWLVGDPIKDKLDDYNNGLLCAKHRDRVYCGNDNDDDPKWCRDKKDGGSGKPDWWDKSCKDDDDNKSWNWKGRDWKDCDKGKNSSKSRKDDWNKKKFR